MTLVVLLATIGLWPGEVAAGAANARVAIGTFRGPKAASLQDAVEAALLRRYALVPESRVAATARQAGIRLRRDDDFVEVARLLKVRAFVSATVTWNKSWRVEMLVRDGDTGQIVGRYDWRDTRIDVLATSMARATPGRLRTLMTSQVTRPLVPPPLPDPPRPLLVNTSHAEDAIMERPKSPRAFRTAKVSPPKVAPEAEARRAADPDDDEDDEQQDVAGLDEGPQDLTSVPRPYLELTVGGRVFSRSMSFVDNIDRVAGYRLNRATAATLDLAFHPFQLVSETRHTWAADIGLTAHVDYALGVDTQVAGADGSVRGEVHGYEVGTRYRVPISVVDIVPRVSYVVDNFQANVSDLSPDVTYRVVRMGIGVRVAVTRNLSLRLGGDYLHVMSVGALISAERFPRARAHGVDVGVGAGYSITDELELQISAGMRRYGFDMNAEPGDRPLAGGAVDQYLSSTFGLAYRPSVGRR